MTKFKFEYPGYPTVEFTRAEINANSSKFNCEQVESDVGSEDFIEALVDVLYDHMPEELYDQMLQTLEDIDYRGAIVVVSG